MYLQGLHIVVLGAGVSGLSAARLACLHGADVALYDSNPDALPKKEEGIRCISGSLEGDYDIAVFSPGVPLESELGRAARRLSAKCVGELTFGALFLKQPILAVTGTNGKTTTVEMLAHIINAVGIRTIPAGNIGLPLSQVALDARDLDYVVAEVSSFQLELADGFQPFTAALLNITPDHLVRHKTMEAYRELKLRIFQGIHNPERCIVNSSLAGLLQGCTTFSAVDDNADFGPRLLKGVEFPFHGAHNLENALAATALAGTIGVSKDVAFNALMSFRTGDHRLQCVARRNGIEYIDDSKATNVDALLKALETLRGRGREIVLIAGGIDKECSLDEAIPVLKESVRKVMLIGRCARRLSETWGRHVDCQCCASMRDAVENASCALQQGGIVLLSPACASQDMYKDYAQRGDDFKRCAMEMPLE